jgi:hypothetical protein
MVDTGWYDMLRYGMIWLSLPYQNQVFYFGLSHQKLPKNNPGYLYSQLYLEGNPQDVRKAKDKINASVLLEQATCR